jgi:hypothetical protein
MKMLIVFCYDPETRFVTFSFSLFLKILMIVHYFL